LKRAIRDSVELPFNLDSDQIAAEILGYVQNSYENQEADAWAFATAAEACLALKKYDEALKWISGYSRMPYCDAFELASTHRQLVEVWELDLDSEGGKRVLPILRAELAKRVGATLNLDIKEIQKYQETEKDINSKYDSIKSEGKSTPENPVLEKVFGEDSFKTFQWFNTGISMCFSVARIGVELAKGHGTGFLIKGSHLLEKWGEELYLVTNSHVVSLHQDHQSLRPEEIVVIFEAMNPNVEFRNFEVIWSSPSNELDTCILRFSKEDQIRLNRLSEKLQLYEPNVRLPAINSSPPQKIYVIGHPNGGTLQISFQDNILIDHDEISKIHYRTPTEGGSSGSPVFNQQWGLIGLHHAGSTAMPRLKGNPGIYEANEGIWFQAIIKKIKDDLNN
jgi:V8-like Glu-specific endopeptidase